MTTFTESILEVHHRLDDAHIPHAFGGALALLFCTGTPRTTADVDVNVFVPLRRVDEVLEALSGLVEVDDMARLQLHRDGQARLWLDTTAIDVFCNTTPFHERLHDETVHHELLGEMLPFLSCDNLTVFKAFFDRRRDWADIEEMVRAEALSVDYVAGVLVEYFGAHDHRVADLRAIEAEILAENE